MSEHEEERHSRIARRAYEISESDDRGSDDDNWRRAEEELNGSTTSGGPDDGPTGEPWAKTSSGDADKITQD
jgi:Protein of unknown function (DUF2934)